MADFLRNSTSELQEAGYEMPPLMSFSSAPSSPQNVLPSAPRAGKTVSMFMINNSGFSAASPYVPHDFSAPQLSGSGECRSPSLSDEYLIPMHRFDCRLDREASEEAPQTRFDDMDDPSDAEDVDQSEIESDVDVDTDLDDDNADDFIDKECVVESPVTSTAAPSAASAPIRAEIINNNGTVEAITAIAPAAHERVRGTRKDFGNAVGPDLRAWLLRIRAEGSNFTYDDAIVFFKNKFPQWESRFSHEWMSKANQGEIHSKYVRLPPTHTKAKKSKPTKAYAQPSKDPELQRNMKCYWLANQTVKHVDLAGMFGTSRPVATRLICTWRQALQLANNAPVEKAFKKQRRTRSKF